MTTNLTHAHSTTTQGAGTLDMISIKRFKRFKLFQTKHLCERVTHPVAAHRVVDPKWGYTRGGPTGPKEVTGNSSCNSSAGGVPAAQ